MLTQELVTQIKIKMIQSNIKQCELAAKLGLSRQYLNNVITGRNENLLIETKILKELGIDDTRTTIR